MRRRGGANRRASSSRGVALPFRVPVFARKAHKWLGLVVGAQVVVWSLSGLYMTAVNIDIIHGDQLVRSTPQRGSAAAELVDPIALVARERAEGVRLVWLRGRPGYVVEGGKRDALVDAQTGAAVAAPTLTEIRALARSRYTGDEPIASARLITEIPGEIRGREPPLWRVEFAHWNKPTFYLSPVTGELVSRRHELWRVFDFVWMLHIMDYDERENVNNLLLRVFTWGAVAMALSGVWLLFYAFPRRKRKARVRA